MKKNCKMVNGKIVCNEVKNNAVIERFTGSLTRQDMPYELYINKQISQEELEAERQEKRNKLKMDSTVPGEAPEINRYVIPKSNVDGDVDKRINTVTNISCEINENVPKVDGLDYDAIDKGLMCKPKLGYWKSYADYSKELSENPLAGDSLDYNYKNVDMIPENVFYRYNGPYKYEFGKTIKNTNIRLPILIVKQGGVEKELDEDGNEIDYTRGARLVKGDQPREDDALYRNGITTQTDGVYKTSNYLNDNLERVCDAGEEESSGCIKYHKHMEWRDYSRSSIFRPPITGIPGKSTLTTARHMRYVEKKYNVMNADSKRSIDNVNEGVCEAHCTVEPGCRAYIFKSGGEGDSSRMCRLLLDYCTELEEQSSCPNTPNVVWNSKDEFMWNITGEVTISVSNSLGKSLMNENDAIGPQRLNKKWISDDDCKKETFSRYGRYYQRKTIAGKDRCIGYGHVVPGEYNGTEVVQSNLNLRVPVQNAVVDNYDDRIYEIDYNIIPFRRQLSATNVLGKKFKELKVSSEEECGKYTRELHRYYDVGYYRYNPADSNKNCTVYLDINDEQDTEINSECGTEGKCYVLNDVLFNNQKVSDLYNSNKCIPNVSNGQTRYWCYTNNPNKRWGYCKTDASGNTINETEDGDQCQSWDCHKSYKLRRRRYFENIPKFHNVTDATSKTDCYNKLLAHKYCTGPASIGIDRVGKVEPDLYDFIFEYNSDTKACRYHNHKKCRGFFRGYGNPFSEYENTTYSYSKNNNLNNFADYGFTVDGGSARHNKNRELLENKITCAVKPGVTISNNNDKMVSNIDKNGNHTSTFFDGLLEQ